MRVFRGILTFFILSVLECRGFEGLGASASPPAVRQIVIDPGHGGKDPGAISKNRMREKDVVLAISKKLSATLKKRLNARVTLTRNGDRFIPLDGRNRIANERQCDLFLSIHANASKNPRAEGIEIYYLNKATDAASRRLARRENVGAPRKEREIEGIVSDLIQTEATEEAAELSRHLARSLRKDLENPVTVKTALFYVLVGAKCPGLLIETGFVTHPKEAVQLKSKAFQAALSGAIADGVLSYFAGLGKRRGDL